MKESRLAIMVGHSPSKQGAVNKPLNFSEYKFNSVLATLMLLDAERKGMEAKIFYRSVNIQGTVGAVNKWNPEAVIELHCNAFDQYVEGHEVLYWCSYDLGTGMKLAI